MFYASPLHQKKIQFDMNYILKNKCRGQLGRMSLRKSVC